MKEKSDNWFENVGIQTFRFLICHNFYSNRGNNLRLYSENPEETKYRHQKRYVIVFHYRKDLIPK